MDFNIKWNDYYSPLQAAIEAANMGTAIEFGVATGKTLRMISERFPAVGFDSFDGLPEHWRPGFEQGMFAQTPPQVNADLVIGLFDDTLPGWVESEKGKFFLKHLSLLHIDCDLYSSTKTILRHVGPHIKPDVVVVFDEYHGYPGWENHEFKAWNEFVSQTKINYDVLGYGPEQAVFKII
jgi:hypothetical protein